MFEDWSTRFGEDASLLSGLWVRALEGADNSWRVGVHVPGASNRRSWRRICAGEAFMGSSACCHLPRRGPSKEHAFPYASPHARWERTPTVIPCAQTPLQATACGRSLFDALQKRDSVRPTVMQCVIAPGGSQTADRQGQQDEDDGDSRIALQVILWRADALVSIVELDGRRPACGARRPGIGAGGGAGAQGAAQEGLGR